jgi:mono/diheme cytochrome c family protein
MRRFAPLLSAFACLAGAAALRAADTPAVASAIAPNDLQFFESKIRPILADRCYKCHSHDADKVKGGLMLDTREALMHGGNSGASIVPGKPGDSLLIQAVNYKDEDLQMPPKGDKLSDAQIADLTEWVRRGAPDPRSLVAKGSSATYGGVGKAHWSFQPVKKPALPTVSNPAWCKTPVDNFVLAKLDANGMAPNTPADKSTLIRRVTFDLIGLPPSEAEIEDFLTDTSPNAYARVVDRLLASPHYGERWARYWLDVARYSDTKGEPPKQKGEVDPRFPFAWTYRDYVIDAFNKDKPYNQFIIEQLAADRLEAVEIAKDKAKNKAAEPPVDQSKLAALGFLTLGPQFEGRMDDIIGDRIDVTTKAFLGLTVACARCHDHKFDPIPTKDYYSLYGVFANTVTPGEAELPALQTKVPRTAELLDYIAKADELKKKREQVDIDFAAFQQARKTTRKPDPEGRKQLLYRQREVAKEIADLDTNHPGAPARANAIYDSTPTRDYPVLLRGEVANKGDVVPRRFLEILSPDPKHRTEWHRGSGRLELALAIADPKNPMTARVLVNRLWQQHWGNGIVLTPDDLGNQSAPPTHPELLDWLAATFVEGGWSIKNIQRQIVLSNAYQQSCTNNPAYAETDPDNKFLWRYNLRRMDFEEMHDALLAITGELDRTMGGRPAFITSEGFATRRAIYTTVDRRAPPELLTQFDFPSPDTESGRRYSTIVPQQDLFLMNSPMVIEAARKLVDRSSFASLKTDEERVSSLYLAIYQRPPTKDEIALAVRYVKSNPTGTAVDLPDPSTAPPAPTAKEVRKDTRQANNPNFKRAAPGKFAVQLGGVTNNGALDAWTKLAHALFQTNEAMFYD